MGLRLGFRRLARWIWLGIRPIFGWWLGPLTLGCAPKVAIAEYCEYEGPVAHFCGDSPLGSFAGLIAYAVALQGAKPILTYPKGRSLSVFNTPIDYSLRGSRAGSLFRGL